MTDSKIVKRAHRRGAHLGESLRAFARRCATDWTQGYIDEQPAMLRWLAAKDIKIEKEG